jgi:hypothetical protein
MENLADIRGTIAVVRESAWMFASLWLDRTEFLYHGESESLLKGQPWGRRGGFWMIGKLEVIWQAAEKAILRREPRPQRLKP